jgi:hypothetical protein
MAFLRLLRLVKALSVPYLAESHQNDYAWELTCEEIMRKGFVGLLMIFSGCSFGTAAPPPPPPALPEIAYVAPCDPKAVAGLTKEAVEALRSRDLLLRRHIQKLERQIQGVQ